MKYIFTGTTSYLEWLIIFIILQGSIVNAQNPAILSGIVTNAANAAPVIGAKIIVANQTAYSVYNGVYSATLNPPGTYTVTCSKPGFDNFTSAPIVFTAGVTTTLNISLNENANPPPSVLAVLDTVIPRVHLSWPVPSGSYEILYDDGIQDNFTVW